MTLSEQGISAIRAVAAVAAILTAVVGAIFGLDAQMDAKIEEHDERVRAEIVILRTQIEERSADRWTATQERLIAKERESMMNEWSEHWRRYIRSLESEEPIEPPPLWREPDPRDILNRDD